MVTRRLRVFSEEDISKITGAYHQWRNVIASETKQSAYKDVEGFCKAATLNEIIANNYVLSPGRYVGTEAEEDDGVSFEEKMQKLTSELAEQFEESGKLEEQIKYNLKNIGFSYGNIIQRS
jgi:type I restriction enzyme M protein